MVFAHVALVALSVGIYRWVKHPQQAVAAGEGKIQLALLLDTSSSMSGLIDQARSQLWKVVTRLDAARREGRRPRLEIALYEYGNPTRASAASGWIRRVSPFTGDPAQRQSYLQKQTEERAHIQQRIRELSAERDKFVAAARTRGSATASLDSAMLAATKSQAAAAGFRFE